MSLIGKPLDPAKFRDPRLTAAGDKRATVGLKRLRTLWFNTGTLCNIACANCYIESTPRNDRLAYLTAAEVERFLDEAMSAGLGTEEIGFTGGEPFMNRDILEMLEAALARGFRVLVLTNAMRPMQRFEEGLLRLRERFGERLRLRVSIDHYSAEEHEKERGPGTWAPMIAGLRFLAGNGFAIDVAGRLAADETEADMRRAYDRLFLTHGVEVDAFHSGELVLFPEMDARVDVPEITEACWGILKKSPDSVMCAESRMVVKRRGAEAPVVLACTLIAYDEAFEMGETLVQSQGAVPLNHPHCARFCVLGGASCSVG